MDMLVVVQGNHQGQRYPIDRERLAVGRDRHCEITLDDEGISRRHASFFRRKNRVHVEDLGSTNGTYLNNLLLKSPAPLANGDRISMGNTVMLAQIDNPSSTAQRVVVSELAPNSESVIKVDVAATSIFDLVGPEVRKDRDPKHESGQHAFLALYQFIARINGILDIDALCDTAVEEMVTVCKADRGAILLLDRKADLVPRATYTREGEEDVPVSRTLLEEVLTYRKGLLSQEASTDKRFQHTRTIRQSDISSLMCVPLLSKDKALGAIYVDTTGLSQPFTESRLHLFSAMAVQLSTCIENANLYAMLKDSEEFGSCVLKSMAGGLLVVDNQGRIVRANAAAGALCNMDPNELIGALLAHAEPLAELNILVGQTLRSRRAQESDKAHIHPAGEDNRRVPVGVTTAVLEDYAGHPIGVVAHFRDMTRLRELAEQVRRTERLAALGQMASGIAHEIRNPLNSVQGFVQILQESAAGNDEKKYCRIVLEEVGRINRIVQDMLDFARQKPFSMEPLDLAPLLDDLVAALAPDADAANVRLRVEAPDRETPFVMGNADKIKQVLYNLVRNAIQASPPDGGEVTLRLREERQDAIRQLGVEVRDTGDGIAPEDLGRIFDPFFTRKDDGTGLGLSICQKIAEQHEGRIAVESRVGDGSVFTLFLPVVR